VRGACRGRRKSWRSHWVTSRVFCRSITDIENISAWGSITAIATADLPTLFIFSWRGQNHSLWKCCLRMRRSVVLHVPWTTVKRMPGYRLGGSSQKQTELFAEKHVLLEFPRLGSDSCWRSCGIVLPHGRRPR